jgi:hypothetical protein
MPFSLGKEAETASMMTLHSELSPRSSRDGLSSLAGAQGAANEDEPITKDEPKRPDLETFVTAPEVVTMPSLENGHAKISVA